jgi:hypothetical protein
LTNANVVLSLNSGKILYIKKIRQTVFICKECHKMAVLFLRLKLQSERLILRAECIVPVSFRGSVASASSNAGTGRRAAIVLAIPDCILRSAKAVAEMSVDNKHCFVCNMVYNFKQLYRLIFIIKQIYFN